MEVDAFVSTLKVDQVSWPYTWREIDDAIIKERGVTSLDEVIDLEAITPVKYPWPSHQLNQETVRSDLQAIWDTFIANDAQLQICLPNSVFRTTKFRYDHFQRFLFISLLIFYYLFIYLFILFIYLFYLFI